mmetsp:Transcript_31501/g.121948  ORF Transcript_31501/g.121948 Transcript_31501/m.121948 type:complete len:144 (-) Transcript_31501:1370-1801(-)
METYSTVTRFILICNYISRIIAPLASRCAKFRFQPLPTEVSLNRLSMICKAEQVNASEDLLKLIITRTNGDLRKALMTLQSASRMVPQGKIHALGMQTLPILPTKETNVANREPNWRYGNRACVGRVATGAPPAISIRYVRRF